jgi:hypothetical protein
VAEQLAETENRLRYALCVRTLFETALIRSARATQAVTLEEVIRQLHSIRSAVPAAASAPAVNGKGKLKALIDDPVISRALDVFEARVVAADS